MAAAIIALTLEAEPDLTWRDVQHIMVRIRVRVETVERNYILSIVLFIQGSDFESR